MSPQVTTTRTACYAGGAAVRNGKRNNRRIGYVVQDRPGSGNGVRAHHGCPATRDTVSQIMDQTYPKR